MRPEKIIVITLASTAALAFACGPPSTSCTVNVDESTDLVKCYGVNNCKGLGACKTAINICKGENGCKGQGFALFTATDCLDICGSLVGPPPPTCYFK